MNSKICVAGDQTLIGSAIFRELKDLGWTPMWLFEDALRKTYSWFLEAK